MVDPKLTRMSYLIGESALNALSQKTVLVCGVGGVGSFCVEALARSGVGRLIIVDHDNVDVSNLNRQIMTDKTNVGLKKVDVMKNRIEALSDAEVTAWDCFVDKNFTLPENVDYVVDCIDTLSGKVAIACACLKNNIPFVSAMGSAKRLSSEGLTLTSLDKTRNDPLARHYRRMAKENHLPPEKIRVIFCDSAPVKGFAPEDVQGITRKERYPMGSFMPVVGAVGLKAAETAMAYLLKAEI